MRALLFTAALALAPASAFAQAGPIPTKSAIIHSAASNNSQLVGTAEGHQVFELTVMSVTGTAAADIRLYDTAVAPTCSSATGVIANYPIAAGASSPGFTINMGPYGKSFYAGVGVCITAGTANNDNTSATTGLVVNFTYR